MEIRREINANDVCGDDVGDGQTENVTADNTLPLCIFPMHFISELVKSIYIVIHRFLYNAMC
jgi:hypothetical protein